jgi:hypothetical protein
LSLNHTTSDLGTNYIYIFTHPIPPPKNHSKDKMCTQHKTFYTLCKHQISQPPNFCTYRYKFLLGHTIIPRITRLEALCPACLATGKKTASKDVRKEEESDDESIHRLWTRKGLREAREKRERATSLYRYRET